MNMAAEWKLNDEGNVELAPVTGYTIAMFYDQIIAMRLEFVRSDAQLQAGAFDVEQVLMSPAQALEIGQALVARAELAMRPTSGPAS